jgi:hypothetical protein
MNSRSCKPPAARQHSHQRGFRSGRSARDPWNFLEYFDGACSDPPEIVGGLRVDVDRIGVDYEAFFSLAHQATLFTTTSQLAWLVSYFPSVLRSESQFSRWKPGRNRTPGRSQWC